eukprot:Lankesteria_metandrocarpae@DN5250_c0_g1_i2.p1
MKIYYVLPACCFLRGASSHPKDYTMGGITYTYLGHSSNPYVMAEVHEDPEVHRDMDLPPLYGVAPQMGFDPDNLPHGRPNTLPIPRPELPDADGTIIIGGGIVGPGTNPDSNGGVIIGGGVIGVNPNEDNSFPNNFPNLPNRPGNNPNFPNFPVNKPNYPNLPNLPDTDKEGVIGGIIGALRPQHNEEDRFPNLPNSNGILGHEDPKLTAHISLEGEMHIHVDSGSLCNDKCCCDGREDLASGVQGALENGKEIIKDAVEQAKENQMENTSAQRPRHTVADNEAIKAFKERHSGKSKFLDDEPMMIELVPGMKEEVWRGFHLLDNIRTHITYAESSKPTDGYHYGTEIDSGAVVKIVRWVANNQEFVKAAVRAHDLGLLSAVPTESGGYVCKLLSESKLSQSKVCVPTIDLMKMTLMFRKRLESVLQNISSVRSADDRDPTSSRFRGTLHPAGDPETMPHPTEFDYYPSTMGWRSWWR